VVLKGTYGRVVRARGIAHHHECLYDEPARVVG
jgi:hypothetical protein